MLFVASLFSFFFFFNVPATTEIYTLSLHDALPIWLLSLAGALRESGYEPRVIDGALLPDFRGMVADEIRSEEHTSELQSRRDLVCRLLLEKKKKKTSRAQYPS